MLSKKTKYGINAVIYLSRTHNQGPVLIEDLAQKERLPKKFLEAILLELKNRGILQSKKGKGGGYYLARPPAEITMGQVIRVLEGPLAPVSCVSQTAYHPCEECLEERCCGLRLVMKDVRDAIANVVDKTTMADVLKRSESQRENQTISYQI